MGGDDGMRIFLFSRKNIAFYVVALLALAAVTGLRQNVYVDAVNTSESLLPIYSVDTHEKCVAITFDSAWGDEDTEEILNILAKNGVRATFFVTGDYLDRCAPSAKRFFEASHEIANHSDMHPHPNKLSREELLADTAKCNEKIYALTNVQNTLYRAPYGEYNDKTVETITNEGYMFIQWDVDSLDYKGLAPEEIAKRVCSRVQNGSIVLFHTGTKNTAAALELVLTRLAAEGYCFKPVGEMIYRQSFYIDRAGRQISEHTSVAE